MKNPLHHTFMFTFTFTFEYFAPSCKVRSVWSVKFWWIYVLVYYPSCALALQSIIIFLFFFFWWTLISMSLKFVFYSSFFRFTHYFHLTMHWMMEMVAAFSVSFFKDILVTKVHSAQLQSISSVLVMDDVIYALYGYGTGMVVWLCWYVMWGYVQNERL